MVALFVGIGLGAQAAGQDTNTDSDTGWLPDTTVDPITDVRRVGARLGNIFAWCEPRRGFMGRHPVVVILTEGVPEGVMSTAGGNVGLSSMDRHYVAFDYRFDQVQGREGDAWVADDYQGIQLCAGIGRDCAGGFMQRMYAASHLVYRVDVLVTGSETASVSLEGGKEHLFAVMDECNIQPRSFPGIGSE